MQAVTQGRRVLREPRRALHALELGRKGRDEERGDASEVRGRRGPYCGWNTHFAVLCYNLAGAPTLHGTDGSQLPSS